MTTYDGRFEWELQYLAHNAQPTDRSGKTLAALDYAGQELTDQHMHHLATALAKNRVFVGPLYLSSNHISTMVVPT
jgi:hypothetical protein